jgi:hypothetical protein
MLPVPREEPDVAKIEAGPVLHNIGMQMIWPQPLLLLQCSPPHTLAFLLGLGHLEQHLDVFMSLALYGARHLAGILLHLKNKTFFSLC